MNQTQNVILQQNLDTLTILLKHWLIVLEQVEIIQSDLENIPTQLELLQTQLEQLKLGQKSLQHNSITVSMQYIAFGKKGSKKSSDRNTQELINTAFSSLSQHQQIYWRMQSLLTSFDSSLVHWSALEGKIANLIALREIIETLQERIREQLPSNLAQPLPTPTIDKSDFNTARSNLSQTKNRFSIPLYKYALQVRNFTTSKLGISLIILGFFLSWGIANYLSEQASLNKQQPKVNQIEKDQSNQN